jgi:electron transfer flavoprotein beta subunit
VTLTLAVCLKAAWRTDVAVRLSASGNAVRPDGAEPGLTAPDSGALACALSLCRSLRDGGRDVHVFALTVGPAVADGVLRTALAAGADEVLRVWPASWPRPSPPDLDGSGTGTRIRARLAADALRGRLARGPLLVLAGEASTDEGHAVFGAALAHALGLGFAHRATHLEAHADGWLARVKLERGYTQELPLEAAAVVTLAGPGPRLAEATWPAWLASRTAPIPVLETEPADPSRLGPPAATALRAPLPRVKRFRVPDSTQPAEVRIRALLGSSPQGGGAVVPASEGAERQAEAIVALLKQRGYAPAAP